MRRNLSILFLFVGSVIPIGFAFGQATTPSTQPSATNMKFEDLVLKQQQLLQEIARLDQTAADLKRLETDIKANENSEQKYHRQVSFLLVEDEKAVEQIINSSNSSAEVKRSALASLAWHPKSISDFHYNDNAEVQAQVVALKSTPDFQTAYQKFFADLDEYYKESSITDRKADAEKRITELKAQYSDLKDQLNMNTAALVLRMAQNRDRPNSP